MRAVVHLREEELADRRAKGLDRWDEMWEGVLHMTPAPSLEHQRMLGRMIEFLGPRLRESGRGALVPGVHVFRDHGETPDTKKSEIFRLAGSQYVVLQADADGWLTSAVLGVRLRRVDGRRRGCVSKTPPILHSASTSETCSIRRRTVRLG